MKVYSVSYTLDFIMHVTEIVARNYTGAYLEATYALPSPAVIVEVTEKVCAAQQV